MPDGQGTKAPWLPPRWFIRLAWSVHRGLYRVTGSRVGLWRPREQQLGHAATDHDRSPHRSAAQRHHRVLRGRPEPGRGGDERVGRGRPRLVAQPPGPPGRVRRSGRRAATGPRPRRHRRRAVPTVATLARGRQELRRPRGASIVGDHGGGAGAQIGGRLPDTVMRCPARETTAAVRQPERVHPGW